MTDLRISSIFDHLSSSKFRSRFRLSEHDRLYAQSHTVDELREHARRFITERLAPAEPVNDGKQTPMRGHPVFTAQHACACCCRTCLFRWHHVDLGRAMTEAEIEFAVDLILEWIRRDLAKPIPSKKLKPQEQLPLFPDL